MKRRYVILLLCSLLGASGWLQAQPAAEHASAAEYLTETDIFYGDSADAYQLERCRLDVYYPTKIDKAPVVIWFHGGGLTGGNKFIPTELQNSGLVVVAANYRFMNKVDIRCCLEDAAAVVAWTCGHIDSYHGDKQKIIVSGHSAGGFLTSMIGLDKQWLAPYGLDPDSLAGLAPYSGQAVTHFERRRQQGISDLTPTIDAYAPLHFVRSGLPPMLIISGDRELELFGRYEEQAYFWRLLKLHGNEHVYLYEIQGYDHGSMAAPAHHILKNFIKTL